MRGDEDARPGGAAARRDAGWHLAADDLRNRLAVVARVYPWIWRRPVTRERLPGLVTRAYSRGSFRALWALEALGYHFAASASGTGAAPSPPQLPVEDLPPESLLMLHVGIGMALARRHLLAARHEADADAAAIGFLAAVRGSARPGFLAAAVEPLGVVTRFERRRLVAAVGRAVSQHAPELAALYWHGVGRCLLFVPSSLLPSSDGSWRAARRLIAEVPAGGPLHSARTGWACGVALVHMHQPWLLADLLRRHGDEIERADDSVGGGFAESFSRGVAEAIEVRREVSPDSRPLVDAFLFHRPDGEGPAPERWHRLVESPGLAALAVPLGRPGRFDRGMGAEVDPRTDGDERPGGPPAPISAA